MSELTAYRLAIVLLALAIVVPAALRLWNDWRNGR